MRTARVLTGAALAITAPVLSSGPAHADDAFGQLEVSPSSVRPGATVTVNTTACGPKGHGTGDASAVGGPASFDLTPGSHKEVVVGRFKVPDSAKPGTYGIGAKCDDGKEATGDLMVTEGAGGSRSASSSAPASAPASAAPASQPAAPSMPATMPATPASPPWAACAPASAGRARARAAEIVAGAAVLATAAVAGTWFLRRRGGGSRV
ncbi:hypothetical protein [Streptomyces griseocarneus]|uniref:Sortase n=1 Tax=Streptomyces griseocarneus TaxID=51201 RepID=A0ABX7RK15_9ACTN|nr:hypothetical protein [Streptomyces griseocarneus]QSY47198.1 hypothetical protein J3S04_17640 [Streptomyces griseocarneus]